jgi:hypothetical protein
MINLSKTPVNTQVNLTEPAPIAIQGDGNKCYLIKSIKDDCEYKIWAETYEQALQLLPMIENF